MNCEPLGVRYLTQNSSQRNLHVLERRYIIQNSSQMNPGVLEPYYLTQNSNQANGSVLRTLLPNSTLAKELESSLVRL